MHGFLNVFTAAALARAGAPLAAVEALLRETDGRAFRFGPDGLRWCDFVVTTADLRAGRRSFALSFGSCSFSEPVADLEALGVLAPTEGPGPAAANLLAPPRGPA
jgi:hypothetical protein